MPEHATAQTLLGFDHGEKRIGVAVGQRISGTASPVTTLAASNGQPDWQQIEALLGEWRPQALVVGWPLQLDGGKSATTLAAERFARRLEGRYHLPVHLQDERFTSVAAEQMLESRGRLPDKAAIDSMAARIILQHWLDTH